MNIHQLLRCLSLLITDPAYVWLVIRIRRYEARCRVWDAQPHSTIYDTPVRLRLSEQQAALVCEWAAQSAQDVQQEVAEMWQDGKWWVLQYPPESEWLGFIYGQPVNR